MTKKYRLSGIDCAGCAAKAERAVAKVKGVLSASLNFFTQTLLVEVEDGAAESILSEVERVFKRAEPDAKIKG